MIRKFAEWYCGYDETVEALDQHWQLEVKGLLDKLDESKQTCASVEEKCKNKQERIDSLEKACREKQAEIDSLDSKNRILLKDKANQALLLGDYAKKIEELESRCRNLAHPVTVANKKRGSKKKISSTSV